MFKVYPEANMVDVLLFDGSILRKVQVASVYASSKEGAMNLPIPKYNKPMLDRDLPLASTPDAAESDVFAIVGFLRDSLLMPIVLGFLFPENNELLCTEEGLYLWKHSSNVYTRISKNADVEFSHPSGFFIKVGANQTRTEIDNYDKNIRPFKWKNPTTGELADAPIFYMSHPSGDSFTIDAEGNFTENIVGDDTINIDGKLDETVGKECTLDIGKTMDESSKEDWTRTSETKIQDTAPEIHHNSGRTEAEVPAIESYDIPGPA